MRLYGDYSESLLGLVINHEPVVGHFCLQVSRHVLLSVPVKLRRVIAGYFFIQKGWLALLHVFPFLFDVPALLVCLSTLVESLLLLVLALLLIVRLLDDVLRHLLAIPSTQRLFESSQVMHTLG